MHSQPVPKGLDTYFDRAGVALALAECGGDNLLVRVNDRFVKLTGYDAHDVVGKNCRLLQGDADNRQARERIHAFLGSKQQTSVRTSLINFRKDGVPFVNLLYMSKLKSRAGRCEFIFASQFDISRSQPEMLAAYDAALSQTLADLKPAFADTGLMIDGSLMAIANTAATVAQAKLTLAEFDT